MSTNKLFSLEGRTVLITGASSGIGETAAWAMADAGARVIVAARRKDRLDLLVSALRGQGHEALAVAMDVADPVSVTEAFSHIDQEDWLADVIINNAGVAVNATWLETDEATWTQLLQINLLGADRVVRAACKRLIAKGKGGRVINIASVLGMTSQPVTAAYGSTKAALIHLTKKMAVELARYRINVTCLAPGMFRTAMIEEFAASPRGQAYLKTAPSHRMGETEELMGTLLYLASAASSYVSGVVIPVDEGNHLRAL